MRTMRESFAALLLLATLAFSTSASANFPVVHHALADTAAGTLTLDGDSFGTSAGRVWLAKSLLTVRSWGDKQVVATLPEGTAPGSHLVTLQTSRLLPAFFVMNVGGTGSGGEVGSIAGVVSACGTPVRRTVVYIPGRSFVVFTGESGAFRIDNVPVGAYNVVIETPGQPATTLPGVAVSAGEATDTGTVAVIDLSSNAQHCGACGNTCLGGPNTTGSCVNGTCQAQGCALGWANCNGSLADGCEMHIQTNPTNCGACGISCMAGATCVAGLCMGGMTGPTPCATDATCPETSFCDSMQGICQVDGIVGMPCTRAAQCSTGTSCEQGICQFACPAGMFRCATGACVGIGLPCP